MMNHRKRLMSLLCLCLLALSGCTGSGIHVAQNTLPIILPPAMISHVAPIGDAALEYATVATLYLPRHDGTKLIAVSTQVTLAPTRPHAESMVRALLIHPGDGIASAIGGNVKLALYGINPVEVSRNVATVNLAASALQLDRKALYIACQAIANTLTELPEINYVNVLVVDRPIGLDIGNTLPMGTLSRDVGQDIGAIYEQLLLRRVEGTESAVQKPLSSNVTLYFPVSGTSGLMSEVRACSFPNQVFADMVVMLLRELAQGSLQNIHSPALPLLSELLTAPPEIVNFEEQGGQIATLSFAHNLDDMLATYGITRAQSMASLCYTLCSYFPNIGGIHVTIGDTPVGTLLLTESFQSTATFPENVQKREDYATLLYNDCTLFFANKGSLVETKRPIPYYQRGNPRTLLIELSKGPQNYDSVQGLDPIMPPNAVADTDILGLAISNNTLLVNFAPPFANVGKDMGGAEDRLLAYAIVNTLCFDARIKSVCFFLSGSQFVGFTEEIYWSGLFHPMLP